MVDEQVYPHTYKPLVDTLQVEVVTSAESFDNLREPWDLLVRQSAVGNPFLSHHWLSTWWRCFGADRQLHVVIVKSANEWVAAVPMMIEQVLMCGVPVRRLCSLYNYHTPRFEMIVRERSHDVYSALWNPMSAPGAGWDVVMFPQLEAGSPSLTMFERLASATGWHTGQWAPPPSPYIRIGSEAATLFGSVRGREAAKLRRRYRRLCQKGKVELEILSNPEDVREAMPDGLRIEAAAWKGQAGTAMKCDPNVERFYVRFAGEAAEAGELRLVFLRFEGRRIAFDYVLRRDRALYGIKIGYDPEFRQYSPGHLLRGLILQHATQEGMLEYDFLGADDNWKRTWTSEAREHRWLFMFRNTAKANLIYRLKFDILPAIRRQDAFNYVRAKFLSCDRTV